MVRIKLDNKIVLLVGDNSDENNYNRPIDPHYCLKINAGIRFVSVNVVHRIFVFCSTHSCQAQTIHSSTNNQ